MINDFFKNIDYEKSSDEIKMCIDEIKKLNDTKKVDEQNKFLQLFFGQLQSNFHNENNFTHEFNKKIIELHIILKNNNKEFFPLSNLNFESSNICQNCKTKLINEGNLLICEICGLISRNQFTMSWSDVSRVHSSPIYFYDRKIQFKTFLINLQAKNSIVNYAVLDKMKVKIKMTKIQFLNLMKKFTANKNDIDNIHALYYKQYNLKKPLLGNKEFMIINDFETFTKYKLQHPKYKNINICNQFLAYQLLNKHNIKITKDDVLLTEYFGKYSDNSFKKLFEELNWIFYL